MAITSQLGNAGSNLPTIQRLYAEDYKDSPNWFRQQFIQTMNIYMQPVYGILNGGIDVSMNTLEEFYVFSFPCNSATASNNTYSFSPKKFVGAPHGVIICQCYNATASSPTAIGNPVTLDWYYNGGKVQILAIYGLTSGQTYNITVRIC